MALFIFKEQQPTKIRVVVLPSNFSSREEEARKNMPSSSIQQKPELTWTERRRKNWCSLENCCFSSSYCK
jgi:hypothetical protein